MSGKLTPMMEQYQRVRRGLPANTLLLFRLGDFYEMFFEDAKDAASILNVALTKRNGIPMCGVPHHALDAYLAKIIKAGKRAAICDQVGEVTPGRIVERELTQIVSPGTVSDPASLEAKRNNFLAAVACERGRFGLAFIDLSTGEFQITEVDDAARLEDELARVSPAEILVSDEAGPPRVPALAQATPCDGYAFIHDQAHHLLCEHFKVQSLDGFGATGMPLAVNAAGAILHYLTRQLRRGTGHILRLRAYKTDAFVDLGTATQENLDLVRSRGSRDTSLLAALDRTVTPMGARMLRQWILHPLRDIAEIRTRQQLVADLLEESFLHGGLREALKVVRDIERTLGRLSQGAGNPRDLLALRVSLEGIPAIRALLGRLPAKPGTSLHGIAETSPAPGSLTECLLSRLHEFPGLVDLLQRALVDDPPANFKDGGVIRAGYNPDLDELRNAGKEGKDWLASLQEQEIKRTGIRSLKIRYNAVFGYFIEITKSNLAGVPGDYQRKQTMANAERFITPELKEVEGRILGADERARGLEHDLFAELRAGILEQIAPLQESAAALAALDVVAGLAESARLYNYCRPVVTDDCVLEIEDGRHPVLDQNVAGEKFVPNDTLLDSGPNRLLIITGPNMAGKSTFIRQVALITLMAQIGSFVPARRAAVGIVDRIFTRVGANDDLSRGQSTFMVEMNETANIVNNATGRSLVILDEIGRGTSTFDGLSIAWSVAEHLHDSVRCRTLFATHYHELTDLAATRGGVKNFNVAVREWNDQIVFLHKIVPGSADKSYGIQVAKLAGLPAALIARAKEILANLERAELNAEGAPALAAHDESPAPRSRRARRNAPATGQLPPDRPQMDLLL